MNALYTCDIATAHGKKTISVIAQNILDFEEEIDILTTSAFYHSYEPTPKTMFFALQSAGICVKDLAIDPLIDLRSLCNVWLSKEVSVPGVKIKRVGCVEMSRYTSDRTGLEGNEQRMLDAVKAYFQMLDIAAVGGVKMNTVAMPLLGAGSQRISDTLTIYPILNECVNFLKRNLSVDRVVFIDMNQSNAFKLAQIMSNSFSISKESTQIHLLPTKDSVAPLAFISYATADKNIADNLCSKLESKGIKVWYAPRDVHGDYATSIANAIEKATYFVVILSENSMRSQHVLNEIDLAFQYLPNHIKFKPLRIDKSAFEPAFNYYLSRQHWIDAHLPPIEIRLHEFVNTFDCIGDDLINEKMQ